MSNQVTENSIHSTLSIITQWEQSLQDACETARSIIVDGRMPMLSEQFLVEANQRARAAFRVKGFIETFEANQNEQELLQQFIGAYQFVDSVVESRALGLLQGILFS